ncbi:hypothetical protein [Hydrogenivirga sp. 128-5-R1-1]|uniref:hypothetical protein n=1 Tax=Hydrogenivirga sp. 128-5-R1-1 TaxID=392423 RepID=UPI00015F375E|nr:hypothetical protein [Hydrogenivirga sp. 128-5-R1-1]EDP76569.1 hypothetical protein HG1285_03143 [Hydrogenivirga sp. 128-5-R1-1]
MKGRVALSSGLISVLLIGCGGYDGVGLSDDNSAEAKRYEVLKAIDEGNYDFVIQALSSDITYGGAFTQDEGRLNLASAYVGKAGFDANDIVKEMVNTVNNNTTSDDFQQFIQALSKNIGTYGTLYLSKASALYGQIAGSCNPAPAEDIKKDACFYRGIVDVATAAVSIVSIVKDVNDWLNPQGCAEDANGNSVGDDADASACAIEYGANGSCTVTGASLTSLNSNLTFTDSQGNNYSFELVKIDVSGGSGCTNTNTFYRLIDNGSGTMAVTEGYCDTNFNPCNTPDGTTCYPCPVVDNGDVLDITETIVNTVESSQQIITSLVQGTDTEQAVNDFITEVCGADQNCTESEIASYLQ